MEILKGQRSPLVQILQNETQSFRVKTSVVGISIDFSCFAVTENNKLLSNDYRVFFSQPKTPCGGIEMTLDKHDAVFSCDLSKLPATAERLVFTATIDDSDFMNQDVMNQIGGAETMKQMKSGEVTFVTGDSIVASFKFNGSDFGSERALILGEIYKRNGEWRFNANGQGFKGGLESLLEYFGGEIKLTRDSKVEAVEIEPAVKFEGNIFAHIGEQAKQIETHWSAVIQGICDASSDYLHLDKQYFNSLNEKFQSALQRLNADLESPTLILATTGTTSSGKSTIVNLLCGADLMPRMAQEMSAGVVYINHSPDGKRHLKIHPTDRALWECGEWHDLSDEDIQTHLKTVMDLFNQNRGMNQPATPHIELTYPIACFNNDSLLKLTSVPATTQFKIMDLPGLRNQQDNTNGDDIRKNCRDALCLVAYNMEETDENRRLELVNQVLEQIKQMGGSPARMLFVLNRIDVFRKDPDWERYQAEHIAKTQAEIANILSRELPEHRDVLATLSYSPLSSLPALHSQRIRMGNNPIHAAKELDEHFSSLIPGEIIEDLPRSANKWNQREFERVSNAVWQNSYGGEFFQNLDGHIQAYFPTLVIPTIVQRFEQEVSDAIGDIAATCYSEMNSSKEDYEKAVALLHKQNSELRSFLDNAKQTLQGAFDNLLDDLKKNPGNEEVFEFLAEDLLATDIYRGRISSDKLNPLYSCFSNIRAAANGVMDGMKQTIDSNRRDFSHTTVEQLPERLQEQLAVACSNFNAAKQKNEQSLLEQQLGSFFYELNLVANEVVAIKSDVENSRIYDTVELLMKHYLNYLQEGVETRASQWNLSIGHHVLKELPKPSIRPIKFRGRIEDKSREERVWYTLWVKKRTITWKELPNSSTLHEEGLRELADQIDSLVEPFHAMMRDYIIQLNNKIVAEQNRVLKDFEAKLAQANAQHHEHYDKVLHRWQPLEQQSRQLNSLLKQLVKTGKSV
jgi:stress response protein SCP2/energy-coupling factor transporter ATP-binding protein EcfA2